MNKVSRMWRSSGQHEQGQQKMEFRRSNMNKVSRRWRSKGQYEQWQQNEAIRRST